MCVLTKDGTTEMEPDREPQGVTRNIKEAMYIHINDPLLNRNVGKISSHTYGARFYKTHQHSSSNNPALPPSPYMGQFTLLQQLWEGTCNFIGKYCPMWGCLPFSSLLYCTPPHTPLIPKIPQTPLDPHFSGAIFGMNTHLFM